MAVSALLLVLEVAVALIRLAPVALEAMVGMVEQV